MTQRQTYTLLTKVLKYDIMLTQNYTPEEITGLEKPYRILMPWFYTYQVLEEIINAVYI